MTLEVDFCLAYIRAHTHTFAYTCVHTQYTGTNMHSQTHRKEKKNTQTKEMLLLREP